MRNLKIQLTFCEFVRGFRTLVSIFGKIGLQRIEGNTAKGDRLFLYFLIKSIAFWAH
jgi:uncharacterized membrane protein